MAEYIEREVAIDALQNHYEVRNAVQNGIMDECVMLMMRVPAADVVARDCYDRLLAENDELRKERPVRHGRWIVSRTDYGWNGAEFGAAIQRRASDERKPITNYDRIISKTPEELAEWLEAHCYQYGWLDWLKQEAKE